MLLLLFLFKVSFASVVYKAIHSKNYPVAAAFVNQNETEQEAFRTLSIPENDNDTLKVTEKNIAGASENNLGITADGLFKPLSDVAKKIITIQAENCGKSSFPHRFFIDDSGKPMMLCEPHNCLKAEKIECKSNIQMEECNKSNEWIAGFIGKNNGTHDLMEVECCHYKDLTFTAFLKNFNITSENPYDHDIIVENQRLVATDFINNIKKIEIESSKATFVYSASVYRMRCPSPDSHNPHNLTANVFDEQIRDFSNTKIDSKEKAELFASTLKYIIAELDKRSKLDNITSDIQNSNSMSNNETSVENHPMLESITSKEEAALQASAMRFVANELTKGPYGNVFSDINGPPRTTALPARKVYLRGGNKVKNPNYPTHRLPFDDIDGPNYSTFDGFS